MFSPYFSPLYHNNIVTNLLQHLFPDTHASVSVNMPKELYEQLKVLAKKNHRSVSAEICRLVEKELEAAKE